MVTDTSTNDTDETLFDLPDDIDLLTAMTRPPR